MKFNYSVYRPNHLIRDTYKEQSSYYRSSDVHATPMTAVGDLQGATGRFGKHIPVRLEESEQTPKSPVFPKNFSMAKFMAARSQPTRKQLMFEPAAPVPYRRMPQRTIIENRGSTSSSTSFRDRAVESLVAIGSAIASWYLGVREWLSELWLKVRSARKHYSMYGGVDVARVSPETIRAGLLGFGLFVAVMFTFFHHSIAPGVQAPGTSGSGPQSETLGTGSAGGSSTANSAKHGSSTSGNTAAGTSTPTIGSASTSGGSPASGGGLGNGGSMNYTSAGTIVGGYGGGSSTGTSLPSTGTDVQPSGGGSVLPSPTPSPQPSVPGVTTPLPITVPGQGVDVGGKPVAGTSPITLTLN